MIFHDFFNFLRFLLIKLCIKLIVFAVPQLREVSQTLSDTPIVVVAT